MFLWFSFSNGNRTYVRTFEGYPIVTFGWFGSITARCWNAVSFMILPFLLLTLRAAIPTTTAPRAHQGILHPLQTEITNVFAIFGSFISGEQSQGGRTVISLEQNLFFRKASRSVGYLINAQFPSSVGGWRCFDTFTFRAVWVFISTQQGYDLCFSFGRIASNVGAFVVQFGQRGNKPTPPNRATHIINTFKVIHDKTDKTDSTQHTRQQAKIFLVNTLFANRISSLSFSSHQQLCKWKNQGEIS